MCRFYLDQRKGKGQLSRSWIFDGHGPHVVEISASGYELYGKRVFRSRENSGHGYWLEIEDALHFKTPLPKQRFRTTLVRFHHPCSMNVLQKMRRKKL